MSETQQQTAATPAPATPAADPAAAAPAAPAKTKIGKAKAAKASATPPATPAAPAAPAAKPGEPGAVATPAGDFKPEVTVQGQKKIADAQAEADKKAAAAAAKRTPSKTLDQVRAERRALGEAAPAADAAKTDPAAAAPAGDPAKDGAKDPAKEATDKAEAAAKAETEAAAADKTEADKKAAEAKTKDTVDVDIPPEKLKEFTKLNRDLEATRKRVRELETEVKTKVPDADKLATARKLAAEGKHFDAIKAAGLDFDAAAAEVLRLQGEENEVDPEVKKLRDLLEDTRAELDKLKTGAEKTDAQIQEEAKKQAKAQRAAAEEKIVAEITLASERFPYLSKDRSFVREALDGADEAYPLAVKQMGRPLTDEEKNNLLRAALEEAEERHAARARLYGTAPAKAKTEPAPAAAAEPAKPTTPATVDASMRGGLGTVTPRGKTTLADIKSRRRAESPR